jgi:DNA integrity scanning protein DisA with diadenylate cyclase activity
MGRLRPANEFARNESGSSHRASSRSDIQTEYGVRRRWRP